MVRAVFGIVRALVGLRGTGWSFGGLYGVVSAGIDRAWGAAIGALVAALVGFCLAYSAFVRSPWERRAGARERGS